MVEFSWLYEYKDGPLLDDLEHLYRNAWRRVVENLGCYATPETRREMVNSVYRCAADYPSCLLSAAGL